jgi:hypothetical protein
MSINNLPRAWHLLNLPEQSVSLITKEQQNLSSLSDSWHGFIFCLKDKRLSKTKNGGSLHVWFLQLSGIVCNFLVIIPFWIPLEAARSSLVWRVQSGIRILECMQLPILTLWVAIPFVAIS